MKHITYSLIEWNQRLKIKKSLKTIFQTIKERNVKLESPINGPKETEDNDLSRRIGRKLLMKMGLQHTPLEREEVVAVAARLRTVVVVLLQMLEEVEHNNIERKKPPSDNKELKKRTSRRK